MHSDEMCVMEVDFNQQVTHFPTGKKYLQKLNSHHVTAGRQSLSADLSSAPCLIGSTHGSCTESRISNAFCATWKGNRKSCGQLPSRAAPASAAVWAAVVWTRLAAENLTSVWLVQQPLFAPLCLLCQSNPPGFLWDPR